MNKIKRSGRLLKTVFVVLGREKKLFFFPPVTSGLILVTTLFFVVPVTLFPTGHSYFSPAHWSALGQTFVYSMDPASVPNSFISLHDKNRSWALTVFNHGWVLPLLSVIYFASMIVATFSNVAFYHEIMQALDGDRVSIHRGLRYAVSRWRAVLLWSLFAGLVGYIIKTIQEHVGFLGRIITGFVGAAWSVACIFVIPTLVRNREISDPVQLIRDSAATLKRTWGELVIGFAGLDLAAEVIVWMGVGAVIGTLITENAMTYVFGLSHGDLILWTFVFGAVAFLGMALLFSWICGVVYPVYRCALYIYATEGVVPESFDKELLDSAWKVR